MAPKLIRRFHRHAEFWETIQYNTYLSAKSKNHDLADNSFLGRWQGIEEE